MTLLWGCGDINFTVEGYKKAVLSGLDKIPEARQFDEIFGKENVDHFIGYSGDRQDCRWTTDVYLRGRYGLSMQVKVQMGRSFDEVLEVVGDPIFVMVEFREVSEDGISARMNSGFEREYGHFDRKKWREIYDGHGNFAAAGIPLKEDQPVEHFDEFVAGVRRDRVQVKR